jgi:methylthioribulose-1-phosphate dehydratase
MSPNPKFMDVRKTLIEAAGDFYRRGWMVGTAGNLSAKTSDRQFWITASGCHKGKLTDRDFVEIDLAPSSAMTGFTPLASVDVRPSAETSIHAAIYRLFPDANACYHVHSVPANLASNLCGTGDLELPPLEMLKGLGIWEEQPQIVMPVFANHLDVESIATEIAARFQTNPPSIPALLIRNHGVTVWADSLERVQHHLEIVEYIFQYTIAAQQLAMHKE